MVIAGRVRKDPPRDRRDCASPTLSNGTFNVPQSAYASVLAIASLGCISPATRKTALKLPSLGLPIALDVHPIAIRRDRPSYEALSPQC
jgi:hypothetical protein